MALLEFRSKAAGGFFLLPATFQEICKVLGRSFSQSGSWTVDELPQILETLEQEVAREKKMLATEEATLREKEACGRGYRTEDEEQRRRQREDFVSFGMRTVPLREMLRAAIAKRVPVMWGIP
mgnify:FL=1